MAEAKCARCLRVMTPDDSVTFEGKKIVHLDCLRPRELTPEERALLYVYCWGHVAAKCVGCGQSFQLRELAADPSSDHVFVCPRCRADMTDGLRGHLYGCGILPEEVRRRAQEVRDAACKLVKQGVELSDRADVLIREAEAANAALRETMRRIARRPTS